MERGYLPSYLPSEQLQLGGLAGHGGNFQLTGPSGLPIGLHGLHGLQPTYEDERMDDEDDEDDDSDGDGRRRGGAHGRVK
jgi:hypothetical protein